MSSTANSQSTPSPENRRNLDDDFAKWMKDLLDEYHIIGASIGVVDNGIVESAGYGLARLPDVLCTGDTIYRMASTSKAIGAAVMGLILEDDNKNTIIVDGKKEKLTWSTPIIKILGDDFDFANDDFNRNVTIEDALSNRSGLSGHDSNFGPWMGKETRTYVRSLRHLDAVTAPIRTTFQYTNTMFGVIGYVIEKLEGKSFEKAAMDRIWKPLGMTSTFAKLSSLVASGGEHRDHLARGYYWATEGRSKGQTSSNHDDTTEKSHYVAEAHLDFDLVGPAAAVLSTANDYSKWIAELLRASKPPQEKHNPNTDHDQPKPIISHKLFDNLSTARTLVIPSMGNGLSEHPKTSPQLYALGWFAGPWVYPGQTVVHHPGGCQGFGTHVFLVPEHQFGVVVVENRGGGNSEIAESVGSELIGRRLGIPREKSNQEEAKETAAEWDPRENDTSAEKQYLKSSTGDFPNGSDATVIPGTYENKAYGKIEISLAPNASLQTQNPTIEGVRIIRSLPNPPKTEATETGRETNTDTNTTPYHVSFLGLRTFLASMLLHPSRQPHPQPQSQIDTQSTTTFLTVENLWPHGPLQSDPTPNLPAGHGNTDDPVHPFIQEPVYESQGFMAFAGCVEVERDGDGHGDAEGKQKSLKAGLVMGRTECSEFKERSGREGLPEEWRRKMVWFEKV